MGMFEKCYKKAKDKDEICIKRIKELLLSDDFKKNVVDMCDEMFYEYKANGDNEKNNFEKILFRNFYEYSESIIREFMTISLKVLDVLSKRHSLNYIYNNVNELGTGYCLCSEIELLDDLSETLSSSAEYSIGLLKYADEDNEKELINEVFYKYLLLAYKDSVNDYRKEYM